MSDEKVLSLLKEEFENKNIVRCIFSNMKGDYEYNKIIVKPLVIKNNFLYQFEQFKNNKAYHENITIEEAKKKLQEIVDNFYQHMVFTKNSDIQIIRGKKDFNVKKVTNEKEVCSLSHNKTKKYILEEGTRIPFLIKLGIMGEDGKVFKNSYDKFRQINKYLEFIDDTIKELKSKKLIENHIKAVDFGCGKSYLTFALHHYLKNIQNMTFEVIGLDLKKDVIEYCNKVAKELNLENLEFLTGDIKDFDKLKNVDMIFSLHACNNATDYSLLKGLELNAKVILAVPCCQHEFNQKMSSNKKSEFYSNFNPIGKHGILLEKFASIATDAFRAQALELCGYKTQVMEFIDMEHTPKNILIREIVDKTNEKTLEKKLVEYENYKNFLGIEPLLDTLLRPYFKIKEVKNENN
ncbi:class I SAM-dependent methyltransferase [Fusobacterium perfoetens]|uniref:class I SAM-dependent methyltransferase n=1 Tax=Fusobacterium perfoetens TaxID=852 RepID=UPI0004867680|nr:SAM-dependent methyltransferase [Fusobacterium perfoetens]